MTPIAGDPDSFPATYDIPDDSDPPAASTFNVAYEALADRTAALASGYRNDLATTAALKAIDTTAMVSGGVRYVAGLGRFVLDKVTFPTFAETLPVVVAPTVGTGRWYAQDVQAKRQWVTTLNATTTANIPPNISVVELDIFGGGGGGGGGASANTGTNPTAPGGGGGQGSQPIHAIVAVTPGGSYTFTRGDGGTAGTAGSGGPGGDGGDGGGSTFVQGTVNVAGPGGQGGRGGALGTGTAPYCVPGGLNATGAPKLKAFYMSTAASPPQIFLGPGGGGWSADNFFAGNQASAGSPSINGNAGGARGAQGATNTNPGGSSGGGGGGGPGGAGGQAGSGGAGQAAGSGSNGTAGVAVAANSGAGGGGGGGGGNGTTSAALGAVGIAGGSGAMTMRGVV